MSASAYGEPVAGYWRQGGTNIEANTFVGLASGGALSGDTSRTNAWFPGQVRKPAAAGAPIIGVAMQAFTADQKTGAVRTGGVAWVRCTEAMDLGDPVSTDANGYARKAQAGDYIAGYAHEAVTTAGLLSTRDHIAVRLTGFEANSDRDGRLRLHRGPTGGTVQYQKLALTPSSSGLTWTGGDNFGQASFSLGGSETANNWKLIHTFDEAAPWAPSAVLITPLSAKSTGYVSSITTAGFNFQFTDTTVAPGALGYSYLVLL